VVGKRRGSIDYDNSFLSAQFDALLLSSQRVITGKKNDARTRPRLTYAFSHFYYIGQWEKAREPEIGRLS
jgi:hypothetical protein